MQNLSYQSIGTYTLGNLIAAGTYATVYELPDKKDTKTDLHLVMKVFSANLDEDASYRRRFEETFDSVGQLEHRYLMPIYDYGIDGDTGLSYVILPYYEPGILAERFSVSKTLSRQEGLKILGQIAEALDEIHHQGFVHGDLKPSNIFFDDNGDVLLADTGLAGILQETFDLVGSKQHVGSPAFLAPELWQGQTASPASDNYALGILAYQLLVGKLPFEASTVGAVEYQHLNEMPIPLSKHQPDLPSKVDTVIERILAKQSSDRYQVATGFRQALKMAIGDVEDVEITVQPILQIDTSSKSKPLLSSSETMSDESEKVDNIETVVQHQRSPILRWMRRVGCFSMIVVWMLLMLSPCLLLTVIVRGEATLPLSDKPGHEIRLFKVFEDDVRGFGLSWGNTQEGNSKDNVCVKTQVRYFTWQGSGENVDFCLCYTRIEDEWIAGETVDDMCNPSQN